MSCTAAIEHYGQFLTCRHATTLARRWRHQVHDTNNGDHLSDKETEEMLLVHPEKI
jgi:hypothetical protein